MESMNVCGCDIQKFCDNEHEKMDSTPENIKKIDQIVHSPNLLYNSVCNQNTCNDIDAETIDTLDVTKTELCSQSQSKESIANDKKEEEDQSHSTCDSVNDEKESSSCTQELHITSKKDDTDNDESNSLNSSATMMLTRKQSCAFIIEHFSDKDIDAEVQAAKYKNMIERIQNRHRRGASLSKLEDENKLDNRYSRAKSQTPFKQHTTSPSSTSLIGPPASFNSQLKEHNSVNVNTNKFSTEKVKIRVRDRSNSRVRNVSKRHSWSPQSSTHDLQDSHKQQLNNPILKKCNNTANQTNCGKQTSRTSKHGKQSSRASAQDLPPKGCSNIRDTRTRFTPRSTAMQLAFQQMDFMCPQPPLTEFKQMHNVDRDDISETGTYTLDGDNYTEEQKDLMNIDKNLTSSISYTKKLPPRNVSKRSDNILEVNYYHEADLCKETQVNQGTCPTKNIIIGGHQIADAYLEKIKSRVLRNMCTNKNSTQSRLDIGEQNSTSLEDDEVNPNMGCITSVTTSGVLAKQRALDPYPKLTRKSGLSTSQIDSSEYVSSDTKLKSCGISPKSGGGFTDHQKAEYRLNVFTNQKDSTPRRMITPIRNATEFPAETSTDCNSPLRLSEGAALQTAQTKHDWIREWARNARARSLASDRYPRPVATQTSSDTLMTRSYTYADIENDSVTDDSVCSSGSDSGHGRTKTNSTALNHMVTESFSKAGDYNYASDPCAPMPNTKPLRSPSKIPSPVNSLRRNRTDNRNDAVTHNVLPQESHHYLQHTIAAINNLQQSLSRASSLKSSAHSSSPKAHGVMSPEKTNNDYSPYYISKQERQRSVLRNMPLMTSSINEQQMQFLRQMRLRKNSLDDKVSYGETSDSSSPQRFVIQKNQIQTPNDSMSGEDSNGTSLKRSSSFTSQKNNNIRLSFRNSYTSPNSQKNGYKDQCKNMLKIHAIKKSISSNDFDQMAYSDYDHNLQYYVNDEDDVGSIGEDNNIKAENFQLQESKGTNTSENCASLSSTRYNKALLMRIECNKQKVIGDGGNRNSRRSKLQSITTNKSSNVVPGVSACPNTPELPRRNVTCMESRSLGNSIRRSVPHETNLNHLPKQIPNSLALAKNQLLQTAGNVTSNTTTRSTSKQRTQPRYLDISKYKPVQSNQFLRKNDSKSTLKASNVDMIRRSPSNSSISGARTDQLQVRSMSTVARIGGHFGESRSSSMVRRDASVSKQKEMEMALWRRRSKYDPLKAVAEDKRKKEEAKRLVQAAQTNSTPVIPTESREEV